VRGAEGGGADLCIARLQDLHKKEREQTMKDVHKPKKEY